MSANPDVPVGERTNRMLLAHVFNQHVFTSWAVDMWNRRQLVPSNGDMLVARRSSATSFTFQQDAAELHVALGNRPQGIVIMTFHVEAGEEVESLSSTGQEARWLV